MGVLRLLVLAAAVVLVLEAVGVPAISTLSEAGYGILEWLIKRQFSP